jgi:hypothetical protein
LIGEPGAKAIADALENNTTIIYLPCYAAYDEFELTGIETRPDFKRIMDYVARNKAEHEKHVATTKTHEEKNPKVGFETVTTEKTARLTAEPAAESKTGTEADKPEESMSFSQFVGSSDQTNNPEHTETEEVIKFSDFIAPQKKVHGATYNDADLANSLHSPTKPATKPSLRERAASLFSKKSSQEREGK